MPIGEGGEMYNAAQQILLLCKEWSSDLNTFACA